MFGLNSFNAYKNMEVRVRMVVVDHMEVRLRADSPEDRRLAFDEAPGGTLRVEVLAIGEHGTDGRLLLAWETPVCDVRDEQFEIRWESMGPHGAYSDGNIGRFGTRQEAEAALLLERRKYEEARLQQPGADTSYAVVRVITDEHGNREEELCLPYRKEL